ncbi:MAG TPA: NADH-quinone oxidoreductase subunit C [Dongiaceae bacterium]|jgi:NADH-quinone oxidoreductase subunit C|nr:NADH-quinone oxidoreductase subunit C [Dongiaceae bacterium]
MTNVYRELGDFIAAALGPAVDHVEVRLGELALTCAPGNLIKVMKFLKSDSNCRFEMLVDICGADYPDREKRFDTVYNLLSLKHNYRVRVKVPLTEDEAVPSMVGLWPVAGWFEREAYDMFGIFFEGNSDLRRILTDYGFEGHPFRKDFPLTGYVEMRYDMTQKRVIYEPVKLRQEFRTFDFESPWEGMLQPRRLPGDEKAS